MVIKIYIDSKQPPGNSLDLNDRRRELSYQLIFIIGTTIYQST